MIYYEFAWNLITLIFNLRMILSMRYFISLRFIFTQVIASFYISFCSYTLFFLWLFDVLFHWMVCFFVIWCAFVIIWCASVVMWYAFFITLCPFSCRCALWHHQKFHQHVHARTWIKVWLADTIFFYNFICKWYFDPMFSM